MHTFRMDEGTRVRRKRVVPRVLDGAEFARTALGLEPDAVQETVLRSTAKRGILNCSRQWGKSTVAAAKAVHRAYTQAKSLVLVASPTDRQSSELLRKAAEMMATLRLPVRGDGSNRRSLLFPNGSRIVGLPGREATTRGFSKASLLLLDEAARVDDSLYNSLQPTLAVGHGDCWMMSTPWGKRGFFYDAWAYAPQDWMRVSVAATGCARISEGFLAEQRRILGKKWFAQEYLCEFVDAGGGIFGRDLVDAALDEGVAGLVWSFDWARLG